jgi:hypothetical protein
MFMNCRSSFLFCIAILFAIIGVIKLAQATVFVLSATRGSGRIVAMELVHTSPSASSRSGRGGYSFRPYFVYSDATGVVYTQHSACCSSFYPFTVGSTVSVLYEATKPAHSELDSFQAIWLMPLLITVFGLLFSWFVNPNRKP